MKRKHWNVTLLDNPNSIMGTETDEFFTTDTEAYLVFTLKDKTETFNPTKATITLFNRTDRSILSEEVPVNDGVIAYEMRHEVIEHAGTWQGQLVYEQDKDGTVEKYTSKVINFSIEGHLLDKKEPALVAIENWDNFILSAENVINDMVAMEAIRQANELERKERYEEQINVITEKVEGAIVEPEVAAKFDALESEYAEDLTSLKQSDQELTAQLAQKITKNRGDVTSADLSQEVKEQMTGGSVAVVGENAVLEENIVDGSVSENKLSENITKASYNLLDEHEVERSGYHRASTGEWVEDSSFGSSNLIPVESGGKFSAIDMGGHVTFWNNNGEYVSGFEGSSDYYITVPLNDEISHMRISLDLGKLGNSAMITKGHDLKRKYVSSDKRLLSVALDNFPDDLKKTIKRNVLNEQVVEWEVYYDSETGNKVDNIYFRSSELIPVSPHETFTHNLVADGHITFWDKDKNFISGILYAGIGSFAIPENAYYFRISLHNSFDNSSQTMIVQGEELPEKYIPYGDETVIKVSSENIDSKSITPSKLSSDLLNTIEQTKRFSEEQTKTISKNLLNYDDVIQGGYYSGDGRWNETIYSWSSGLISATLGETYSKNRGGGHVTFWDENENYVGGHDLRGEKQFTVPGNAAYFRLSIPADAYTHEHIVVKGSEIPEEYIPYKEEKVLIVPKESIEDKSVTKDKLSDNLKEEIFNAPDKYVKPFKRVENPVITKEIVTDRIDPIGVADPFIVMVDGRYHMFFEVLGGKNPETGTQSDEIGHAWSDNLIDWNYTEIVLSNEDKGHRSAYPHVFEFENEWYMLPDVAGNIKLYKATNFPLEWEFQSDLITGTFSDTNIFKIKDVWYLTTFGGELGIGGTSLYYNTSGDFRNDQWELHPSGLVIKNEGLETWTRPGGNPKVYDDYVLLPIQVTVAVYGEYTYLYKLGNLSKTTCEATNLGRLIEAQNNGDWNSLSMHHIAHAEYIHGSIYAADGQYPDYEYAIGLYVDDFS